MSLRHRSSSQLLAFRAVRTGRGRVRQYDRHARYAAHLRVELQPVLRHEGHSSTDLGRTFKETKSAPAFPKDDGRALANIWSLEPGTAKNEIWCGVEPASLFRAATAVTRGR